MELTELHAKFELKVYNGLVRGVNTEKYIHTYINKANHFNTGPTTSSRHSKNIELQPVPPPMPLESLSVRFSMINSASNGIGRGTGCNFIFFLDEIPVLRPISSLCCVFYSYDPRKHIIKIRIYSNGTFHIMGPYDTSGIIRNDYKVRATIMNKGSISVVLNSDR